MKLPTKALALSVAAGLVLTLASTIHYVEYNGNLVCDLYSSGKFTFYSPEQRGKPIPFLNNSSCAATTNSHQINNDHWGRFMVGSFILDLIIWSAVAYILYILYKTFLRHYKKNRWRTVIISLIILLITVSVVVLIYGYLIGQTLNNLTF